MVWTVTLSVTDVNDGPIHGAELVRSTWTGGGSVSNIPPATIGPVFLFTADDTVINITCELRHPRFVTLIMNLVRAPGESVWRWTDPRRQVKTAGKDVAIAAVMGRVRPPPLRRLEEEPLHRRAAEFKQPIDEKILRYNEAHPKHRKPLPSAVPMNENPRAFWVTPQNDWRYAAQRRLSGLHLLDPDILGDATAAGWGRFKSTIHEIDLARDSDLYVVEYGELGDGGPRGPRFLAGVWVPKAAARMGLREMDFLVWLTPNTTPPNYPKDEYPYTNDYPYALRAFGPGIEPQPRYVAGQPYCDLSLQHLFYQHYLSYQMTAAGRAAVIVIPVAPSAHFELLESRATLMRFLKELCLWIPRADRSGMPKLYPPGPRIRRVGVAGFSASVPRLRTLIHTAVPFPRYRDPVWGVKSATEFDQAWGELWAIDGFFQGKLADFSPFLDSCAAWVRNGTRRLRIYKNDFPDGHWDPRKERGAFAAMIKGVAMEERQGSNPKDDIWAVSAGDRSGRWHVAAFSKGYLKGPVGSGEIPVLEPNSPHEMMPRVMFGHAAATSDFARI